MYQNYQAMLKRRVVEALRLNMIWKKRETIIVDIIREKQAQLLLFKSLERWHHRCLEKVEKR